MCDTSEEQKVMTNDGETENKVIKKDKKGWSRFYITVEPIKFCIGFTIAFTSGVTIDLLQRNVCYRKYNMSYAECTGNISTDIKADVEAMTADVNMINNVIQGFCPLLLVLFIGPWSDVNGRKPFILWSLRGYAIYYLLWSMFSFFPNIPVYYFFIPSVPLGLTGGLVAFYVCTFSYTSDNFNEDERAMRFSISTSVMLAGNLFGSVLANEILRLGGEYGFQVVFFTSFFLALLALLYTIFVLEETIIKTQEDQSKLFNFEYVKSIFVAVLVKPKQGVFAALCVLTILTSEIPIYAGDDGIVYMVGKSHFSWSLRQYNMFAALNSLASGLRLFTFFRTNFCLSYLFLSAICPVIGIWCLIDLLGMSNRAVLVINTALLFVFHVLKGISINEKMFWAMALLLKGCNLIGPTVDSEVCNIVSEDDMGKTVLSGVVAFLILTILLQGKAFAFILLIDALSPVMAIPLYTELYKFLLPKRTLLVFLLSAALIFITFLASLGLWLNKKSPYEKTPVSGNNEPLPEPNPSTPDGKLTKDINVE